MFRAVSDPGTAKKADFPGTIPHLEGETSGPAGAG